MGILNKIARNALDDYSFLNAALGVLGIYTALLFPVYSGYLGDKFYRDKVKAEQSVQYIKENRNCTDEELDTYLKQKDFSYFKRGTAMVIGGEVGLLTVALGAWGVLGGLEKLAKGK